MNSSSHIYYSNSLRRSVISSLLQCILLITAIVLIAACTKNTEEAALPTGSHVLALGDSLTEGAGVTHEEAWPKLLAHKTGWIVVNGGISGDTSEAALQRLPKLLERHKPKLVLVALGGNDMLRHIPEQQTITNLIEILTQIRTHGAKPVLLATPNPSVMGAVFQNLSAPGFYSKVAKEHQVQLIEDAIADVLSDPNLKGDPLHPNAAGHARLSEKIFKELQSLGYTD